MPLLVIGSVAARGLPVGPQRVDQFLDQRPPGIRATLLSLAVGGSISDSVPTLT